MLNYPGLVGMEGWLYRASSKKDQKGCSLSSRRYKNEGKNVFFDPAEKQIILATGVTITVSRFEK